MSKQSKGFAGKWGLAQTTIHAFLKAAGVSTNGGPIAGRISLAFERHGRPASGSLVEHIALHRDFVRSFSSRRAIAGTAPESDAFLETYEWRKVRMLALKRYGARCQCCGASPATGAVINVDHIKPRKLFPALALDLENLQVLCHDCNHGKGNWDMTDWRPVSALVGSSS